MQALMFLGGAVQYANVTVYSCECEGWRCTIS